MLRLLEIFIACLFKGSQEHYFFDQTLLFTAFVVAVLKFFVHLAPPTSNFPTFNFFTYSFPTSSFSLLAFPTSSFFYF